MQAYTGFAAVYDKFMGNVSYDEWAGYLIELLKHYGVSEGIVLELGCGTGMVTERLKRAGYDMIGIDSSEDMLSIAISRMYEENSAGSILYLNQDMREFELYGTVEAVVSIGDTMNYITEEEELLKVFRLVNNYLEHDGVFIFDLKTEYFYKEILKNSTFAENTEESSLIWENTYDEESCINEYFLTIYNRTEDELYERITEAHYQRAYSILRIKSLIEEAGMEYITAYRAFTMDEPNDSSERVYVIAREKFQKGKTYLS